MRACFLTACIIALIEVVVPGQSEAFTAVSVAGARVLTEPSRQDPLALIAVADTEHHRIAQAQLRLQSLGLYHGTTNGTLGPQTRSALSEYQRELNLPVTGQLDERTAYALENNDLLQICRKRGVGASDCLDAIKQFYSELP